MGPPREPSCDLPHQPPDTATCAANTATCAAAPCFELTGSGSAPEWVELLPAGPEVAGRDGRSWRLDDPEQVARASLDGARQIPIDWEHASEIKARRGEMSPAAGWITELEARGGTLWGRVEWTERGRESVTQREYRYLSPVFHYEPKSRRIMRLVSAGLVNLPNFRMRALNQENQEQQETTMRSLPELILKALDLAEDATGEQAAEAIGKLKTERDTALNRTESPSLEKFVPRADYDAALERASNAEKTLDEHRAKAVESEIDGVIGEALEAGKITPATADYHRAQCRAEGGLERFREYVKAAPALVGESGLDNRKPNEGTALNTEATRIAGMFGNSAEDLKKYGGEAA